ncbi:PREDICTED: EF-hand calcium-binding domain-containing protein 8 [Condylura cristata]|uniref:EF-hand calcium-binding domain-containing protein 8 n=1 Tax=Condylura cristata TaxID=143302 RepID=UPI000643C325|nr:PREDICTED: EF-hand calcium-binding domain-containing protein 8 [Condylura cristata]
MTWVFGDPVKCQRESQLSVLGKFKNTEGLSTPTPSKTTLAQSQMRRLQEPQLFTELDMDAVEKIFVSDADSTGALNMKTFMNGMRKILSNVSDELLEALFLKMDADCKGSVTWEKYVDYMMREFQQKEKVTKGQYRLHFQLPMRIIHLNHSCEVVKVQFLTQRYKKTGYFLSVTKDGTLQIWSESFVLINSFKIQRLHSQPMWVMDMVCLHNMNLVAVSSTDQKIEFFDISKNRCDRIFTFMDLDSCVLVMDYWSDYRRGVFCYGDTKGNVMVFISDNVNNGLFNPRFFPRTSKWGRTQWFTVSVQKLLNDISPLFRSYRLKALHSSWCEQVKFIPQLNLVASCSAIEKSSLVLTALPSRDRANDLRWDLELQPKLCLDLQGSLGLGVWHLTTDGLAVIRKHTSPCLCAYSLLLYSSGTGARFSVINLRKGILCFDYCADKNFLVTGGYDSIIRLWSPFSKKPVWMLKGHQTSVTHILISSDKNGMLFSISKDKNIRVWDLQEYTCLQAFSGKFFALGNCPITSTYFHRADQSLICSTFSIGILMGYLDHQRPRKVGEKAKVVGRYLCTFLYSKIFRQVVIGCLDGLVTVWELETGRRMMEFSVTDDQSMELTAMTLDESERCLLTGFRDGALKMWNYNLGECLLTFPNPEGMEISAIIHMNKVFYVTGWSKRITCFMFHKTKPVLLCYHSQTFHTEDILSMAKYQGQFIGTSSYSGDILFWNANLLKPILSYNASESPLPLLPKRVQMQEGEDNLLERQKSRRPCADKWAQKPQTQPLSFRARASSNAKLRRNMMSAPPVLRHPRNKEPGVRVRSKKSLSAGSPKSSVTPQDLKSILKESERGRGDFQKKLQQSSASVEKIIFLQTRPRLPQTATLLSSCIDGCIYAWSLHGAGGLLGKFPVDLRTDRDIVVGAMATDENDWILVTGDCKGTIKIWDIKDYCMFTDKLSSQSSEEKTGVNKFQFLIPEQAQINLPHYIPLEEKEVVISAGQDWDVKAWKLSGEAIGTFGLSLWKSLQVVETVGDDELRRNIPEQADLTDATQKDLFPELPEEREFAEALVYQRQEQAALLALLNGKEDKEAEAWAKLRMISSKSPWPGERSPEDIENSWREWESKGKQESKIVGAAYKPRDQSRSPELLFTKVQYGWMRYQISPQIYQSLHFNELVPTSQPDFLQTTLDQQGRFSLKAWRKVNAARATSTSTPTAMSLFSPSCSISLSASLSEVPESSTPSSPRLQFSLSSPRP